MNHTNITNLRKDLYNMIDNAIKYDEPINVSTKNGNAVILSEDEYNNLIETIYISSNSKLKEEIITRAAEDDSNFINEDEVEW